MKAFDDLIFSRSIKFDAMATLIFDNNYGISVVQLKNLWEISILKINRDTILVADSTKKYLSKDQITELMKQIQEL